MKLLLPSPRSLLEGLKTLFFHPMLYGAILLHWAIIQSPLPPEKVEEEPEPEELLAESIPIASSGSLNNLTKTPKPKEEKKKQSNKKEAKPKPKPKPLAQALAKEDPELKKKAEEELKQKLEEEIKAKLEAEKQAKEKETEKQLTENAKEKEPEQEEEKEPEQEEEIEPENEKEEVGREYQGSGESGAVGFNLRLLPQPELVFTPESIQNYMDSIGSLEYQTTVEVAEWITLTTSIDDAVAKVKEKDQYSAYTFEKMIDDSENPYSTMYQLTLEGEETIYMSFIKSKKRTLKSSTVFVQWKDNPTTS